MFRFTAEALGDGRLALDLVRGAMWPEEWKQAPVEWSVEAEGAIEPDALRFAFDGGAAELAAAAPGLWTGEGRLDPDSAIGIACWSDDFAPAFAYDPDSGRCADAEGQEGMNPTTQPYVRETGDGECADLRALQLNETDFGYPLLEWNLAGALLDGARLHFANLEDADLRGASMADFQYGHAIIDAAVDDHTLPLPCAAEDGRVHCFN